MTTPASVAAPATPLRVLILEDRPADAELMAIELRHSGFAPTWTRVDTEAQYLAALGPDLDLILADYTLPQFSAPRALDVLVERGLDIPVIVVTGTVGEEAAVECLRKGASDYLLKDRMARLGSAVAHALAERAHRVEKRKVEEARWARTRQQAAAIHLGQRALAGADLTALLTEAAVLMAETLDVEYTEVQELLPDGQALLLRAGVGWKDGLVGHATVGVGADSQAGFTLQSRDPVITEDLPSDARFHAPPLLRDHGVVSGMSVIIGGKDKAFGVLGAHTTRRRQFTADEVDFLQVVANVLGSAVERKQIETALVNSEARFRSLIANGSDLLGVFDGNGVIRYISPSVRPLTGYDVDEVVGKSFSAFLHPGDAEKAAADLAAIMQHRHDLHVSEQRFRHKDGHWITIETVAKNAMDDPAVGGIVINARDVTERRRAEEEIRVLATTDDLTGITNRREFTRMLEYEIGRAARYGTGVALVMYDLDHFKRVNDTLGHVVGDYVLQEVTRVATRNIRSIDVVARWGGEEFMIMLPHSDLPAARTVAEKLREAVAAHRLEDVGTVTVSCGATAFVPGDDFNSLIKRVDDALYVAKARGRNCVECVYASTQTPAVDVKPIPRP